LQTLVLEQKLEKKPKKII